jgi:hypothetical protein
MTKALIMLDLLKESLKNTDSAKTRSFHNVYISSHAKYIINYFSFLAAITRMSGCQIMVGNTPCYKILTIDFNNPGQFNITCGQSLSGQFIKIEKHSNNQSAWDDEYTLNLCEVEVYAEYGKSGYFLVSASHQIRLFDQIRIEQAFVVLIRTNSLIWKLMNTPWEIPPLMQE